MVKLLIVGFAVFIASCQAVSLGDRKRALLNELESLLKEDIPGVPWNARDTIDPGPGLPWIKDAQGIPGMPWQPRAKDSTSGFSKDTTSTRRAASGHQVPLVRDAVTAKENVNSNQAISYVKREKDVYGRLLSDIKEVVQEKRETERKDNVASAWKRVVNSLKDFVEVSKKEIPRNYGNIAQSAGRAGDTASKKEKPGFYGNIAQAGGRGGDTASKKEKPGFYGNIAQAGGRGGDTESTKRALLVELKDLLSTALGKNTKKSVRRQPPVDVNGFVWDAETRREQPPTNVEGGLVWKKQYGPVRKDHASLYHRLVKDLNGLFNENEQTKKNTKKEVHTKDTKMKDLNDDLAELVKSTA